MANKFWTRAASSGAGSITDDANWSGGTKPVAGDNLYFTLPDTADVSAADYTATAYGKLIIGKAYEGNFGDADPSWVQLDVTGINCKGGGQYMYISWDIPSSGANLLVTGTYAASDPETEGFHFKTESTGNGFNLGVGGDSYVTQHAPDSSSTALTVGVTGNATVTIVSVHSGCTVYARGGELNVATGGGTFDTLTNDGAIVRLKYAAPSTLDHRSGTTYVESDEDGNTGDIATGLNIVNGTVDMTGVRGPFTVAACTIFDGTLNLRNGIQQPAFTDGPNIRGNGTILFEANTDLTVAYV